MNTEKVKKMKRRIILIILLLCCLAGWSVSASAEDFSVLPRYEAKQRPELPELKVYFLNKLSGRAYERDGEVFVSLSEFAELYGININLSVTEKGFTAAAEGLTMDAAAESNYLTVNYRYVFLPSGYILCGEDVYLPMDALERIFGVTVKAAGDRVEINAKQCRLISGSEDYYKLNMPPDVQYWLPRIIKTETMEEPMAGKIAIGNVIDNRVNSARYPDTIYMVIYDNNTGVQFTPATTGSLTSAPDELSWIAACLCYEGYNTAGDSLFFVNPENNGNFWFKSNCTYVTTVGRHEFYK